jgi:hypothetical protein
MDESDKDYWYQSRRSTRRRGYVRYDQLSTSIPATVRHALRWAAVRQSEQFFFAAIAILKWDVLLAAAVATAIADTVPRQLTLTAFGDRVPYHRFDEPTFAGHFRLLSYNHLELVTQHLGLGATFTYKGYTVQATDALAVTLARMAYPIRLSSLRRTIEVNWSNSKLSMVIQGVVKYVTAAFRDLIEFDQRFLQDPQTVADFAAAVHGASAFQIPYAHIVGFIDGTVINVCRPTIDQESMYNGNEKAHILHYLALMLPNGIMAGMYGPYIGESG